MFSQGITLIGTSADLVPEMAVSPALFRHSE